MIDTPRMLALVEDTNMITGRAALTTTFCQYDIAAGLQLELGTRAKPDRPRVRVIL